MHINIKHIRKLPYKERLDMIKCLEENIFIKEAIILTNDYPDYVHNDLIHIIENKSVFDPNVYIDFLKIKNINIFDLVQFLLHKYLPTDFYKIFEYLHKYHFNNAQFSSTISLLEDFLIEKYKIDYISNLSVKLYIEKFDGINKWKLISAMFEKGDYQTIMCIKKIAQKMDKHNPLREKIMENVYIYMKLLHKI